MAGKWGRSRRTVQSRFVRARHRRRAGLLTLLTTVVGIALGILLPRIQSGPTVPTARAGQVLAGVGFGILGLVTVIYSLLFLVVQSSNTTFTPRLNLFQEDPWIWRTYAAALGLFGFSMGAFLAMEGATKVTVIVPIFAFGAALAVIGLMRSVQEKAFASLQMNTTLDKLRGNGLRTIEDSYPERPVAEPVHPRVPAAATGRSVLWRGPQTTLRQLDLRRLLSVAERSGSVVVFRVRVGETLWPGTVVAAVTGALDDGVVVAACETGVNRTFEQDPLLAFRLLGDIGLRALSPAINDPATGVQIVDALGGLLRALAPRDLEVGAITSSSGVTRIQLELPTWADFVGEGIDELLDAASTSQMVLTRARTVLTGLAGQVPPDRRSEVTFRLEKVHAYLRAGGMEPGSPVPETSTAPNLAALDSGPVPGPQPEVPDVHGAPRPR